MQDDPTANVLTYATPATRRYRYLNPVAVVLSVLLLALFYLGFVPSGAMAFDYTRKIPLAEVIAGVLRKSPREVLGHEFWHLMWFLSLGTVAVAAFVLVRHVRLKVAISLLAILLPWLIFPVIFNVYAPLTSVLILPALLGQCGGETWSEGFIGYGAVGGWMILWLLLAVTRICIGRNQPRT